MATTLADVVDQLQIQNQQTSTLSDITDVMADRIGQLINSTNATARLLQPLVSTLDGLTKSISEFIDYEKTTQQANEQQESLKTLKAKETQTENERRGGLAGYIKDASTGGFATGVAEGLFGKGLYGWMTHLFEGLFGRTGILLSALPRIIGRGLGRLGLAGLVLTFGEDVLKGLFQALRDNGILFNWTDEQLGELAGNVNDGLFNAILVGMITRNPLARLGAFIVGYFKDEVLNAVKWIFGIRQDSETGNYVASLPFMDDIDLGPSMDAIETTITGVVTAVGSLLAIFIGRRFGRIPGMVRRLLGVPAAGAGAGAAGAAAGAAATGGRAAAMTAAQRTALNNMDDAALAAQGLARNSARQIVRQGTQQFASNAEMLNALASARNPRFANLLGAGRRIPVLGTLITGGLLASVLLDDTLDPDQKVEELGGLFGSVLGGVGGAAVGGAIAGAIGLTTGPGAILTGLGGAILGGFAGDYMGREMAGYLINGQTSDQEIPADVLGDISYDNQAATMLAGSAYTPGTNLTQAQAVEAGMQFGSGNDQLDQDYLRTITTGQYAAPASQLEAAPLSVSPAEMEDGRLRLYDEFGDYRLLTNQEQQGQTGRLLRGEIDRGELLQRLAAEGAIQITNNYYNTDASTNTSVQGGGGGQGSNRINAPLPARDTVPYEFVGP